MAVSAACSQRHRVLFTLHTVPDLRYPGEKPALGRATRAGLSRWPGIGGRRGMAWHSYDDAQGWRATFYPAGRGHSVTSAVGSAWGREP